MEHILALQHASESNCTSSEVHRSVSSSSRAQLQRQPSMLLIAARDALLGVLALQSVACSAWAHPSARTLKLHAPYSAHGIPRLIHQSWKDTNLPEREARWQASWKALHPDWEYRRALRRTSAEGITRRRTAAQADTARRRPLTAGRTRRLWTDDDNKALVHNHYAWFVRPGSAPGPLHVRRPCWRRLVRLTDGLSGAATLAGSERPGTPCRSR